MYILHYNQEIMQFHLERYRMKYTDISFQIGLENKMYTSLHKKKIHQTAEKWKAEGFLE